ncbi:LSU ribosomal protein L24E [Halorientalis persicus]|jgi:large subunit ribosomal protein L24e|uniref:Large ribosomal subunit protein eL24 n=1 Tax=Halorientalis persicus TaxID=1367881 RepID=A0A1H8TKL3_9EURY|nr:50S ribosomal protein L24e [Halorientalis persicus]SEO91512.1 LSU ribosomal protein L24E [Halorientalis persicus]
MPRTRECDFCGDDIEPGTGTMLVQNDGATVMFCSSKCEKNADLGREARDMGWTESGRSAGGKRAAETADEPEAEEETEAEPEDPAATEADVVEDTGAAPDLEDAESEATPGPEGEGADEAAADADADSAEAVDEDAEDGDDEADEEEAEA